jgi:hypothetical protein
VNNRKGSTVVVIDYQLTRLISLFWELEIKEKATLEAMTKVFMKSSDSCEAGYESVVEIKVMDDRL